MSDHRIYKIFKKFDQLFTDGHFSKCDKILRQIHVEQLQIVVIIGLLSASFPARHELKDRTRFLERARVHLLTIESKKRTDNLLRGLE